MSPVYPTRSSDSMIIRPMEGRSEAPRTATERGFSRASRRMTTPGAREQGDQASEHHEREEKRGDDGDDGIALEPDALEHLLGQGARVAPGDEDGDHRLVEGVQEGEEGAHQDPRP